jgi:hypothetical protein
MLLSGELSPPEIVSKAAACKHCDIPHLIFLPTEILSPRHNSTASSYSRSTTPSIKAGSLPKDCHPQQKSTPSQPDGTIATTASTIPISLTTTYETATSVGVATKELNAVHNSRRDLEFTASDGI